MQYERITIMAIRTTQQLKDLFQQSRERKQKEKEQHKKDRQKQYQQLCKEADQLLKQALQDEKRKRLEQLQALIKKTPQKPLKWSVTEFYISNNRYIEKDADGIHYYQTRSELQQWEKEHWQCINWDVWDRLITETRKQLGI